MEKRKKIVKLTFCIIIIMTLVIISALYVTDSDFRYKIDKAINKEVSESNSNWIEIDSNNNPIVYAYGNNVVVLEKGILKSYDKDASKVAEIDVNITAPKMLANGNYLVIWEDNGNDFCVIYENALLWQGSVDGDITNMSINPNGYLSVIVSNTTCKSIVVTYNNRGVELFKTYLSSTYALCSDISNNNRYLAIGEVNYSGMIVKSNVKIISLDLVKNDPDNSIVNNYQSENGEVITNLNYQIGDKVVCMFNSYIQEVTPNTTEKISDITENMLFVDIYPKNNIAIFEKQSSGILTSDYQVRLINLSTKKESLYFQNLDLIKSLKVSSSIIALNSVNRVQILNKNGSLLKNYSSSKEIKDLYVSDHIIGIEYKDKVEIIGL